jgi:hypothetical protein
MAQPGFHKRLLALVGCLYLAAICYVIFSLVDLQESRYGNLTVAKVSIENDRSSGRLLTLKGTGFDAGLKAIALPELDKGELDIFLEGHPLHGLWSDGRTLLTAYGDSLLLYLRVDIADTPRVIGSVRLPDNISQAVKVGNRALVSVFNHGLFLVDLTDPTQPGVAGKLVEIHRSVKDMVAASGVVYVPDRAGRLHVINLCGQTPEVHSLDTPGSVWRVALHQQRLVSGALDGSLRLFDLDRTGMPHQVGTMQFGEGIRGLGLTAEGLFVALANGELQTFGVRNWPQLEKHGTMQAQGQILRLKTVPGEPLVMLSRSQLGLLTVNVEKPDQPRVVANFIKPGTALDFCLAGQQVYSISAKGLSVFKREEVLAGSPDDIGEMADIKYDVYEWNGEVYLLSKTKLGRGGALEGAPSLHVLPPQATCNKNACAVPGRQPDALPADEECLAVTEIGTKDVIHLFCREDGGNRPRLESSIRLPDKRTKPVWKDNFVFTVSGNGSLRVFDATDRRRPVLTGQLELPGILYDCEWLEPHFLLVAAGMEGLHVVSVEDRSRPQLVASLALPEHLQKISTIQDVLVLDQRVYLAHSRNGVSQVDMTDPLRPRFLQTVDTPGHAKRLAAYNDLLFASIHREGVFLIDISNKERLAPVGVIEAPVTVYDLAVCQGRLALCGGHPGVVQLTMPQKLDVRVEGDTLVRVLLPDDLAPGDYRLYLYDDNESLQVKSAFHIPADPGRQVAQNE